MEKRGAELGLNWIIIAVLAVLVLIVGSFFFLSGSGGVTGTIKDIFRGTTSGITQSIAIENCRQLCTQVQNYPVSLRDNSPYCKTTFKIDMNNDGEADKSGDEYVDFYCNIPSETSLVKSLKVPCTIEDTGESFTCPNP